MTEPKKYNPTELEEKWYVYWLAHNYFHSTPDERTPYTIVIPPPNVTGVLHMGHMLNNTIQDVLIRRARLKGFNAWCQVLTTLLLQQRLKWWQNSKNKALKNPTLLVRSSSYTRGNGRTNTVG